MLKRVTAIVSHLLALGTFGTILLICGSLIIASSAAFVAVFIPLAEGYDQIQKLDLLQDNIRDGLLELENAEIYLVYSEGQEIWGAQEAIDAFAEANVSLREALRDLRDEEYYQLTDSEDTLLTALEAQLQEYRTTSEQLQKLILSETWSWDEIDSIQTTTQRQTGSLQKTLDELILEVKATAAQATQAGLKAYEAVTISGALALGLVPFLAVWAFSSISSIIQPLLGLTRATMAITGGQYRDELLYDIASRRDPVGRLARALENMAAAVHARDLALKAEAAQIREQLTEARRRKLMSGIPPRRDRLEPLEGDAL